VGGTMKKENFLKAIQKLEKGKRKFKQTYELIINLKGLNLKKPDEQVEFWMQLPKTTGKPKKIGAFVGPELLEQAKEACDVVISHDDFGNYTDKKTIKKLSKSCDYFIAQANLMADVAKTFGRYLGPHGKMPNPKAGCVVPPKANLKPLVEKLKNTIKVSAKIQPSIKTAAGNENMKEEDIAENMTAIYNNVLDKLPQEKHNIKNVLIKLTMSKPIKVEEK